MCRYDVNKELGKLLSHNLMCRYDVNKELGKLLSHNLMCRYDVNKELGKLLSHNFNYFLSYLRRKLKTMYFFKNAFEV